MPWSLVEPVRRLKPLSQSNTGCGDRRSFISNILFVRTHVAYHDFSILYEIETNPRCLD